MAKVTVAEIEEVLLKLANHYPETGHNGKTIAALAEDWEEDLGVYAVSQSTFQAAVKVCRRECQFFPKISDVLKAAKTVDSFRAAHQPSGQLLLGNENNLTQEECDRNKRRIGALVDVLGKGVTDEEEIMRAVNEAEEGHSSHQN